MQTPSFIVGFTLAVYKMDEMVKFYSAVFGLEFEPKEMFGTTLYTAKWGEMNIQLCPAELAGIEATQNKHQFDIVVSDLATSINLVKANGGELMHEVQDKSVGIYDPDKNSLVLIEKQEG